VDARPRILIIEDNASLAWGLRINLEQEGFQVLVAETLEASHLLVDRQEPDLIILDLMLPDGSGLDLLVSLRNRGSRIPVIILSAKGDEVDRVGGFKLGADDYVTKPFSLSELILRVKARLRGAGHTLGRIAIGDVEISLETRRLTKNGLPISLTDHEWRLLSVLLESHGQALTRDEIIQRAWGLNAHVSQRNVDFFVSSLRAKIEDDHSAPRVLLTKRGVGYMITDVRRTGEEL
jgi:DNA-binding response OmpR family regulator